VVLAFLLARPRRWVAAVAAAAFFAGCVALLLTFARGAWIGFTISVPAMILLGVWKRRGFLRACGMVVCLGFLLLLMALPFAEQIGQRLFEDDYGRAWSRVPMMQVALNVIRSNPILGVGLSNYVAVMHWYDNTLERISLQMGNPVHNMYLLTAAELGIVGMGLLLWLIAALIRAGWKGFWQGEGLQGLLCLGALAGWVACLIQRLVEWRYITSSHIFALLAGLLGACAYVEERRRSDA